MFIRTALFALMLALAAPGCGGKDGEKDHKDHAHKDHNHKDEGHKDEKDHKDKDEDKHEGPRTALGKADIGGFVVEVSLIGEAKAGGEAVVDVELTPAEGKTPEAPQAVRAWYGVESGDGSTKAKLDKEDHGYHGHVEVPGTIPADAMVWIEVQDAAGAKQAKGFKVK